jgi:hypothetical protein
MKKLAAATILISQVSLGSLEYGFTTLDGFANPEPYKSKKATVPSQSLVLASQEDASVALQSQEQVQTTTNPYEASATHKATNSHLPQEQAFDPKNIALKYEERYIDSSKFILTIADEIDASTMSYRANSSFTKLDPDDCSGVKEVIKIKTSAFYTNQRGEKIHPILLPFKYGWAKLPLDKTYDGYSVRYDGKQFVVIIEDILDQEWVEVEVSSTGYKPLAYWSLREQMLKATGLETDSLPKDLLTIKEEVEANIKDKIANLRRSSPSDTWLQTASDNEVLAEMHKIMGFEERTLEGIICSTLAKKISTNYNYAHDEQKEFKSVQEALAHGSFQCDTAALIMTSILRDHYKIPARIIISYPGVKISGGQHDTQTMVPNTNAVLHATVQVLEIIPGCNPQEFDPTPR